MKVTLAKTETTIKTEDCGSKLFNKEVYLQKKKSVTIRSQIGKQQETSDEDTRFPEMEIRQE